MVNGEVATLRNLLAEEQSLATARSTREHHATLLHYVAANGVEDHLQRTPPTAVEIARLLVDAGANPDATADFYGGGSGSTALVALVTSCHPYEAGVQEDLVREFCRAPNMRIDGIDDDGLPLASALAFFYPRAAHTLVQCGAKIDSIVHAAAVGDLAAVRLFLDDENQLMVGHRPYVCYDLRLDDPERIKEFALVYACLGGHLPVVEFLLGIGVHPDGAPHRNQAGLHLAAFRGHLDVVRYLVEHGANPGLRDDRWQGTPAGWASERGQHHVETYLSGLRR